MTILEAIRAVDRTDPNDYGAEEKLKWLSDFDGQVRADVIDAYLGAPREPFPGYGGTTDIESTRLLIPAPYDGVYPLMLSLKIHQLNADTDRVEQTANELMRLYGCYTDWYNRTHRPRGVRAVRF